MHDRVRRVLAEHLGGGTVPCPVGVGIADGPRAAAIAAQEAIDSHGGRRPLVVPEGATAAFLDPLPVERLTHARTGDPAARQELIGVLRRLGLRTVGRVAALPSPDVQARFGALGVQLHRLANGSEVEPPEVGQPPVDLRVTAAVDPPAERVDRAAFIAKSLADTLHAELASRGLACTRVLVVAETDAGDRIERLWRHEGALSAAAVAQRVRWQLEGWLSTGRSLGRCTGGVNRLELVPDQVMPDDGVQLGFWGGTSDGEQRGAGARPRPGAGGCRGGAGPRVARSAGAGGAVPAGAARRRGPRVPAGSGARAVAGSGARSVADGGVGATAGRPRCSMPRVDVSGWGVVG